MQMSRIQTKTEVICKFSLFCAFTRTFFCVFMFCYRSAFKSLNGNIGVIKLRNMSSDSIEKLNGHGKHKAKRGALIVLEGCDKAGKSTQCRLLVDQLVKAGHPCHLFAFPDRSTEIGKVIDEYLKCTKTLSDQAIHLLFSSNRWELEPTIRTLLNNGETVVCDRYAFSGVAFTAAKGTLSLEWCKAPDVGLPQPDQVFFLNLSKDIAETRGDFGQERYEKTDFQEKVKKVFLQIQDPAYWKVIDAGKTKEVVQNELFQLSKEVIGSSENQPILPLWSDAVTKDKIAKINT